jgi:metal-responsive CopG/Arc/MetJ family transcriptional regulator
MPMSKIAVTIDSTLLCEIDLLVTEKAFPNRSRAVQTALQDFLRRKKQNRLATECAKLDPQAEQALAEEGMAQELVLWPAY